MSSWGPLGGFKGYYNHTVCTKQENGSECMNVPDKYLQITHSRVACSVFMLIRSALRGGSGAHFRADRLLCTTSRPFLLDVALHRHVSHRRQHLQQRVSLQFNSTFSFHFTNECVKASVDNCTAIFNLSQISYYDVADFACCFQSFLIYLLLLKHSNI